MEPTEFRKLFVGGVSRETNEETLREYFSQYGTIEETLVIRSRLTGHGRGFGFVIFTKISMAEDALQRKHHVILGREVEVKKAIPKGDKLEESNGYGSNCVGNDNTEINTKKIFVGGLPLGIKEEEFKSYFESFGTVTDAPVICDKETGRPRGFGFITFDSEDAVNNVLQTRFHKLKYKMVEVKRSHPKDRTDKFMNCYDYDNSHFGFGFGGGLSYGYNGLFYFYPAFQLHHCYGSPSPGRGLLVPASPVCPPYALCTNDYCNGSCHRMAESTADSGGSTGDHASGIEAPATRKSPHIDDSSSLKIGAVAVEHQRVEGEFHDSTASKAVPPSTKCEQIGPFFPPHYFFSIFCKLCWFFLAQPGFGTKTFSSLSNGLLSFLHCDMVGFYH